MKRYRQDSESQEHAPYQQQQQTTVEKQERPFFPPTTPARGDRNVDEQLAEENSGDFDLSLVSLPSTSKCVVLYQSSTSSSSLCDSTDSTTNNQSTNQPLPRKCKLCSYILMESEEYLDHMITHCIFRKETYDEDNYFNGYVDDEELDNPDNSEPQNHGRKKNKTPKSKDCQKCSFIAETKLEFWVHLRQHFVQGDCSGYVCPKCPFASMLKHHMNFHWCSAHDDFKPHSCKHCDYTCVSKSMLTSHLKTHSNVYQFNCATCPYRTKFCNAMKKHLKDTQHQPRMVLRPDGTPNPDITIDVYGTKRGPRQKSLVEQKNELKESMENGPSSSTLISPVSLIPVSSAPISPILSAAIPSTSSALDFNAASMSPARVSPVQISSTPMSPSQSNALATIAHYQTVFSRMSIENGVNPNMNPNFDQTLPLYENVFLLYRTLLDEATIYQDTDDEQREQILRLLQNIHKNLTSDQEHIEQAATSNTSRHLSDNAWAINEPSTSTTLVSELEPAAQETTSPDQPLDLSMSTMSRQGHQLQPQESVASCSSRRKRKRKATRLEHLLTNENTNEQNTNRAKKTAISELATASQSNFQGENQTFNMTISTINNKRYACYTCQIIFVNKIMYAVHMSFHKSENPLECAICYKRCTDVIDFCLHIVRARH